MVTGGSTTNNSFAKKMPCEARKAGDRKLTSFVLRHCSEIFKGAVHRVADLRFSEPEGLSSEKTWLFVSCIGKEILRTYMRILELCRYKDPY